MTTAIMPTVAPSSTETEQAVLGAILLDNTVIQITRDLLKPEDFYRTAHQVIFQTVLAMADSGVAVDNLTLTDALNSQGKLASIGGSAYLAELISAVPGVANIRHHCRIVADKAERRQLQKVCYNVLHALDNGADLPQVATLLSEHSIHAYRPHPPHETNFHPLPASQMLSEPPDEYDWVLEDYLLAGALGLLAGKPKEGKTTIAYELAVKVALGLPFLGRQTRKAAVLILALEEHAREVRLRLRNLGASELDNVLVHVGPLDPSASTLNAISLFAQQHGVSLILIDTLSAFWKIDNENDAAEMTKVVKPLQALARNSGACVLLIHHARKSEGQYGDEIRGSGALFAAVDIALVLKRHEVQTQRLLQAQSRYAETPPELVIELTESGYQSIGDPASAGKAAKLAKLSGALTDEWEDADIIAKRAGLAYRERYRLLNILVKEEKALRNGKGVKGDPFRFRKHSIHATPQVLGVNTKQNSSTEELFDSCTPPSPCTNGIDANTLEEVIADET